MPATTHPIAPDIYIYILAMTVHVFMSVHVCTVSMYVRMYVCVHMIEVCTVCVTVRVHGYM